MKKLKVITGLLLVAVLLATASCGRPAEVREEREEGEIVVEQSGRREPPPPPTVIVESIPPHPPTVTVEPAPPPVILRETLGLQAGPQWATDRMIVRVGQIILVVNDVPVAIEQITSLAEGSGGYVVSSRVWKEGERLIGDISIRVPADYFNNAIEALRELAVDVPSESTYSADVTEEYVDLTAKLENLEATEAQLLTILEKAETVEDILDVQKELSKTRGEIEQTKGRMQYLERTSAMSLIGVQLEQSKLDVEFTADKRKGLKEGEKVQFIISQIAGGFPPYSYEWDFGDGDISTDENPIHAFKDEGSYTISLMVTDDRGNTDTEIRTDYITVIPGWSAGNVASSAWKGVATFGRGIANLFIWLGVLFPIWIVIGVIVFVIIYWRRRRKKRNQYEATP